MKPDSCLLERAVKHFDPCHRLSAEEERKLLEATIQAPTSFNIQHWRFVILRDPALRATIREDYGHDEAQITDASVLVLFTADVKAWSKRLQRDEAQRSIGLAMQTLMLAATGMGYQSCPMISFGIEKLAELADPPAGRPHDGADGGDRQGQPGALTEARPAATGGAGGRKRVLSCCRAHQAFRPPILLGSLETGQCPRWPPAQRSTCTDGFVDV